MIFSSESELLRHLKEAEALPVYFLFGEQGYLKRLYCEKISGKAVPPERRGFNLTCLEGKKISVDEIADSVEALPMMARRRCVVVTDLEVDKLDAREYKKLEDLLSSLPESTVLIFLHSALSVPARPTGRTRPCRSRTGQRSELRSVRNLFRGRSRLLQWTGISGQRG